MRGFSGWLAVGALALGLMPGRAQAQTVAHSFQELRRAVHEGDTVIVVETAGRETWGRVLLASDAALVIGAGELSADGTARFLLSDRRTFSEADVSAVSRSDARGHKLDPLFVHLAGSFSADMPKILYVGQRIIVTDTNGKRVKGTVSAISPDRFTLGGQDTFDDGRVARITSRNDSLLTGTLIGAGIGSALGLGIIAGSGSADASDGILPMMLIGLGAGAGIGAGIDAAIGRPITLYQKTPGRTASARVVPVVSRTSRGALVAVSF